MTGAPSIGHNQPPAVLLEEEADKLIADLDKWLKEDQSITDDVTHESYENAVKKLAELKKRQDAAHKVEKQPWLDGGKAVDDAYRGQRAKVDSAIKFLKTKIGDWLAIKRKRQEEEARKAREEAARAAREAEEARAKAESEQVASLQSQVTAREAEELAKAKAKVARMAGKAKPSVGGGVRIVRYKEAHITNDLLAFKWALSKHGDAVRSELERLATAAARAGETDLPGFEIKIEERAA